MRNTDPRPINVTILHEGESLTVAVSDQRSVGRFGRIELRFGLLGEICSRPAGGDRSAATESAASRNGELGARVFRELLPEGVRDFLRLCESRSLNLQISESLMDVPWEIAFDGEDYLGEKFRIARQIVSEAEPAALPPPARPTRDLLQVLLAGGSDLEPQGGAYLRELQKRLGVIPNLEITSVQANELTRDDALRLLGESDIVHYVGSNGATRDAAWRMGSANVSLSELSHLDYPPQLLVSENIATELAAVSPGNAGLAKAACAAGLSLLLRERTSADQAGIGFMHELYRQLARGAALGEAVRQARTLSRNTSGHGTAVRDAVLYGDPTQVLHPQPDQATQQDDLRQVSIMSHDLVDSTRLLASLGAEKYSDLLAAYHARCARIVASHGGISDDPQGDDGIMCYFGVPVAYEDAAARCLRAAAEIAAAVADLGVGVRIGVATGSVVVKAGQPVGVAIHLAARIRAAAEPGKVLVGDSTRQIVKDGFRFAPVAQIPDLKGFERPAALYRLLGPMPDKASEPFGGAATLTPFVGRERELRLLEAHWTAARAGAARAVLILGEPGIGKSRLVREFKRSAALARHEMLEARCSPDHANSAFHSVIESLRRLLQIRDGEGVESKLDKIEAALASGIEIEGGVQLIASLLSIPFEARHARLPFSPERQRQLTLEVLVRWFCREAGKRALCVIAEDVQWADPSSAEFLSHLLAKAARLPLLAVLTQRPDPMQTTGKAMAADEIELGGLPPDAARALIRGACGVQTIPDETVGLLADRADGVPLFLEESTRMALELHGAAASASALRLTVPATIQDLLMARLDRLASAKPLAQLGAAIGREFSLALLQALVAHDSSAMRIDDLEAKLTTLVYSGLLIRKGEAADTLFYFKHALIRDAAYQSLLERDRRQMHRAIAVVIGEKFPRLVESQPELLAYHFTEAALDAEAISYWERAARRAAAHSAHAEAIGHLTSGLQQLARLSASPACDRAELTFQLLLAAQLIATEGYGAEEVGQAYDRALQLCQTIGDTSALAKIRLGLEGYHFMRADFEQAHANARQAALLLTDSSEPTRRLQARWAVANILFHQGELLTAVEHMDACLNEYQRMPSRPKAVQDPGVMCLCYSAWGKWQLGYPDQALERALRVVALSEKLDHKFSMGEAYGFCTAVRHFRGENERALKCAERAIEICEDNGFAVWLAHAKLMRGRIVAELGDAEAGIAEMSRAYDMWAATGAVVTTPFYLAMQAEGFALAGRPDDGLALLERAFGIACKYGERYYEAEIRRLMGELMLQSAAVHGVDRNEEAERWFLGALAFAHEKQLCSLALRSALSLARLRSAQGRPSDALQILQPVYDWFSEGLGTRDLEDVHALIGMLSLERASANSDRCASSKSPASK